MLEIRHRFPAHAASAAAARRAVEGLLAGSSPGDLDDARIVVSELITYSILHSTRDNRSWIDLTLRVSRDSLRIEIRNGGLGFPRPPAASKDDALSSPSRSIVERLADDWGTESEGVIWAVLAWDRGPGTRTGQFEAYRSLSVRT
jgi:anti-sigma regulatory factor (Ser/Thr protein kinase)